jgi:hypothetical protein
MLLESRMYQTFNNMKRPDYAPVNSDNYARNAIRTSHRRPVATENFRIDTTETKSNNTPPKTDNVNKSTWGRPLWFSLHYGALNYPNNPDDSMKKMMVGYIRGLPIMIPCDVCKNHAYTYISKFTDTQLTYISSDKDRLFKFFWEFHNDVNKRTNKPIISLENAYNIFKNNPKSAL